MTIRSTFATRNCLVAALGLSATLGIAVVGYAFSWTRLVDKATPTASPADEKSKAKHVPIAALRDRMLENFHGKTTDLFTAIPGFGMERMRPLYKYVPFEIPDLSTNEVEVEKEIVAPKLLEEAFAKSLESFRDPSKPLPAGKNVPFNPFDDSPKAGFGRQFAGAVTHGLHLRLLDLVGLNNPDGPRVYSGGKAFEVQRMSFEEAKVARAKNPGANFEFGLRPTRPSKVSDDAHDKADGGKLEARPLDVFEIAGVAELSQGKQLFVRNRGNVIRMLGALRATEQCLQCHGDNKKGDLLGAFSYTFVDTNKSLEKDLKGSSAK